MKHYDYSVKDVLNNYFGENVLVNMRQKVWGHGEPKTDETLNPLLWKYADEHALDLFAGEFFLLDTELHDDYILYRVQEKEREIEMLMFVMIEKKESFIYLNYAKKLLQDKRRTDCDCYILAVYVNAERKKDGEYRFDMHTGKCCGTKLYQLTEINGEELITDVSYPFFPQFYQKLAWVSCHTDVKEWECIFEPDVKLVYVTKDRQQKNDTLASGIIQVMDYLFKDRKPRPYRPGMQGALRTGYQEYRDTGLFSLELFWQDECLGVCVSRRNLVQELYIYEEKPDYYRRIRRYISYRRPLYDEVPELKSVQPLDPELMYAYAVELRYSNGDLRYYYLNCFDEMIIPQSCEVDGYSFDRETLYSVTANSEGGIQFANGYQIRPHILYHRSYRQQIYEPATTAYKDDHLTITPRYREPLNREHGAFLINHYVGRDNECFGAYKGFVDENGERTSPISLYRISKINMPRGLFEARIAPTAKYGVMKADGTWLAPPVFDDLDGNSKYVGMKRTVNGKTEKWLLTEDNMNLIQIPYDVDFDEWCFGLIRVNAEKWEGERPYAGFYDDDGYFEIEAGKWGIMNPKGEMIVEPKYVYLMGFWQTDGNHSIVARYVDGELLWGVIDRSGKETVPCKYPVAYTYSGNAVGFKYHVDDDLYGLMDFDGNILFEPKFRYISDYDPVHHLATVGEHEDAQGVYSIQNGEMLIPPEYDAIEYGEKIIFCEPTYTCYDRYFDYDGNELTFNGFTRVIEKDGNLEVYDGKHHGLIDYDHNILIPPVMNYHSGANMIELYRKGYVITDDDGKQYGLSKIDGTVILPPKFYWISIEDNFLIARGKEARGVHLNDTLYTFGGGKLILQGAYRRISVDSENHTITLDTPNGTEHLSYSVSEED